MNWFEVDRRRFLKMSVLSAGAGLTLMFSMQSCSRSESQRHDQTPLFRPSGWFSIDNEGRVKICIAKSEMGQGVATSLAVLIAEELEADWNTVTVEHAPLDDEYGSQMTGGSTSIRQGWETLRQAGAVGRALLTAAAADTWNVSAHECEVRSGQVVHRASGRTLSYGELVDVAMELPLPSYAALKDPKEFRLIGRPIPRLDIPSMTDGSAVFTADMDLPGLLTATILHCPVFGGRISRVDVTQALASDGVHDVVKLEDAIAVVADDYWNAKKGAQQLEIEWAPGTSDSVLDDSQMWPILRDASHGVGKVVESSGDIERAMADGGRKITAEYALPFQAHATMEPMTCVAHVHDGICAVWAPTQSPWDAYRVAVENGLSPIGRLTQKIHNRLMGHPSDSVRINTIASGGGFGRRLKQDFVAEAVRISKAVGAPVKLIWNREEDLQHDFYRPASHHRLEASLNTEALPIAWLHRVAGPGVSAEGATHLPYDIPNVRVEIVAKDVGVPTGPWRSTAHSFNAFAVECFIDELAVMTGNDPVDYRLALLSSSPRLRHVLELAADKAAWGQPPSEGHSRGVAVHRSYGSYNAQIAEVSIDDDRVRVHRVDCAVDCGMVINPDSLAAQMESAISFGLTAAIKSAISVRNGRVQQSNFDDFPLLRINEMPIIITHIVNSVEPPGGIGELGVPPIAPAVANGVFALTGRRVRRLPFSHKDLGQKGIDTDD